MRLYAPRGCLDAGRDGIFARFMTAGLENGIGSQGGLAANAF